MTRIKQAISFQLDATPKQHPAATDRQAAICSSNKLS